MIKTAKITSNTIVTGLINNPPYIYFLEQNSENIVALIFGKSKVCVCYICFYTLDFLCKTYKYHWNIGFLMTL